MGSIAVSIGSGGYDPTYLLLRIWNVTVNLSGGPIAISPRACEGTLDHFDGIVLLHQLHGEPSTWNARRLVII